MKFEPLCLAAWNRCFSTLVKSHQKSYNAFPRQAILVVGGAEKKILANSRRKRPCVCFVKIIHRQNGEGVMWISAFSRCEIQVKRDGFCMHFDRWTNLSWIITVERSNPFYIRTGNWRARKVYVWLVFQYLTSAGPRTTLPLDYLSERSMGFPQRLQSMYCHEVGV